MKAKLEEIRQHGVEEIAGTATLEDLESQRVKWLGRKGRVTDILRGLSDASPEERPALGKAANEVKMAITEAFEARRAELESAGAAESAQVEATDLSLPGRRPARGHHHLISQIIDDVVDIFSEIGFAVADGPDIETEYYNFDSLNTPDDHPARDIQDTFFIKPGVVLRTHTSPVQMRVMQSAPPPVAVVVPGRAYRVDAYDASHSPMFFQIEGLLVDKGVSFADLKGTLTYFIHKLFGSDVKLRFRPHFFPFTEPSAELDIACAVCKGAGCRVCKNSGWVETLGCGMVHPEVFRHAKYDYENYTGYAFGMGVERIAMLRHAVDGIQNLYENDLRFLQQF